MVWYDDNNTVWYDIITWDGMILDAVVCYDTISNDIVRYDMILNGIVCCGTDHNGMVVLKFVGHCMNIL